MTIIQERENEDRVGGKSRFKDILEVELMVRRDALSINAEQKEESRMMGMFLAWISR